MRNEQNRKRDLDKIPYVVEQKELDSLPLLMLLCLARILENKAMRKLYELVTLLVSPFLARISLFLD